MVPNKNKTTSKTSHSWKFKPTYKCRLCGRYHSLWVFLDINSAQRRAAVKKHGYCSNCQVDEHSEPTCLSGAKCNYYQKEFLSCSTVQPTRTWKVQVRKDPNIPKKKIIQVFEIPIQTKGLEVRLLPKWPTRARRLNRRFSRCCRRE